MSGLGTNEAQVRALLDPITPAQRQRLAQAVNAVERLPTPIARRWTEACFCPDDPTKEPDLFEVFEYAPEVDELVRLLEELGLSPLRRSVPWQQDLVYGDPSTLSQAPLVDAACCADAIVRRERLVGGSIAAGLAHGTLLAALRRLMAEPRG